MSIADKAATVSANNVTIAENEQKVYDAGYEARNKYFWDNFLDFRYNTSFKRTFGIRWGSKNFYPTGDLIVSYGSEMFQEFGKCEGWGAFDLAARFEEQRVSFDTSKNTSFDYMFFSAQIGRIPKIDTTSASYFSYTFYSDALHTIDELVLKDDGTQTFSNAFYGALKNIKISGKIGRNVSFSSCSKLTLDSLKSIITALKDYSGTDKEFTYKLTLNGSSQTLLDNESATIDGLAWREYIESKCWNIA